MNREVHAPFCERPEVKSLGPTHPWMTLGATKAKQYETPFAPPAPAYLPAGLFADLNPIEQGLRQAETSHAKRRRENHRRDMEPRSTACRKNAQIISGTQDMLHDIVIPL